MFTFVYFVKVWFIFSVSFGQASYQPSIHWDPRNPLFKTNVEINVPQHSKLNIVCPNPASVLDEQETNIRREQMYENMWIVNRHEYDTCTVNTSVANFTAKKLLTCNSPLQLKYYPMVFRSHSALKGGIEFVPGTKYYFIATSNGLQNSLSTYNGGHCMTSNMKIMIYICNGRSDPKCIDAQSVSPSPSIFCAPVTQTVNHCATSSLSNGISSSVLVQQSSPVQTSSVGAISSSVLEHESSPVQTSSVGSISSSVLVQQSSLIQVSSADISPSPTNALARTSSTAVQSEELSFPEEFLSLFKNQTHLLTSIYNYTSMIPDLELLIRGINSLHSLRGLNQTQTEQNTNSTKNCTIVQNVSFVPVQPACPLGTQAPVFRNCKELFEAGYILSGIYRVDPLANNAGFGVYCDQGNGGGWTTLLRRYDGTLNFDRGWNAYRDGLGDLTGEFWVGLATLHKLTGDATFTIRFDLESPDGEKKYAEYSGSKLGSWKSKFRITVGNYTGDAGDSFSYHNNMQFSTKNSDNDKFSQSCAKLAYGGWWFNNCQEVCLTGKYENGTHTNPGTVGIQWYAWKGDNYSLKRAEMKIKPS